MKNIKIIRKNSQTSQNPFIMCIENEKGIPTNFYFTGCKVFFCDIWWDEYKSKDGEVIYL